MPPEYDRSLRWFLVTQCSIARKTYLRYCQEGKIALLQNHRPMISQKSLALWVKRKKGQLRSGTEQQPMTRCYNMWPTCARSTIVPHWKHLVVLGAYKLGRAVHVWASKFAPVLPGVFELPAAFVATVLEIMKLVLPTSSVVEIGKQGQVVNIRRYPETPVS